MDTYILFHNGRTVIGLVFIERIHGIVYQKQVVTWHNFTDWSMCLGIQLRNHHPFTALPGLSVQAGTTFSDWCEGFHLHRKGRWRHSSRCNSQYSVDRNIHHCGLEFKGLEFNLHLDLTREWIFNKVGLSIWSGQSWCPSSESYQRVQGVTVELGSKITCTNHRFEPPMSPVVDHIISTAFLER